jgi:hypothetical protein
VQWSWKKAIVAGLARFFPLPVNTMVKTGIYRPGKYYVFPTWEKLGKTDYKKQI